MTDRIQDIPNGMVERLNHGDLVDVLEALNVVINNEDSERNLRAILYGTIQSGKTSLVKIEALIRSMY